MTVSSGTFIFFISFGTPWSNNLIKMYGEGENYKNFNVSRNDLKKFLSEIIDNDILLKNYEDYDPVSQQSM